MYIRWLPTPGSVHRAGRRIYVLREAAGRVGVDIAHRSVFVIWLIIYCYLKRIFQISQENHAHHKQSFRRTPSHVARPVVAPQEIGAELIEAGTADLAHDQIDLADKDVDRLFDPGEPAGGSTIQGRAPHEAEIGAETERDQDIGAAANPAVEQQGQLVADRSLDRRQHVERARRLVELARAMIGAAA